MSRRTGESARRSSPTSHARGAPGVWRVELPQELPEAPSLTPERRTRRTTEPRRLTAHDEPDAPRRALLLLLAAVDVEDNY